MFLDLHFTYTTTVLKKSRSVPTMSKRRKKGKKNKRAAQAENFDHRSSMAITNGDNRATKDVKKQNVLSATAPEDPSKEADIPSSEKMKVHSFMNLEIGPRNDQKKEAAESADHEPRNDSRSISDDREEGKGKISEESDVEMHSTVQVGSLKTVHNGDGLSGATIRFPNGSSWKLTQPLIRVKYQQEIPPFEARQVFECTRIGNTHEPGIDGETAIVKVKYQ